MAISPKHLEEAFMNEVDDFEKKIDSMLSSQKLRGKSVNTQVPSGMSSSHFNILRERYLNVGWKDVVYNDDQREGTWLTFTT
jgi:hypothetical protein